MLDRKIIDVRRSFVPINANEFPETLHATGREDWPEDRIPVIPYQGYNFLPTSYGYRSYFGINIKLNIDALAPNKPDAIFLFQTLAYQNLLIALCDTGIWIKNVTDDDTTVWTQIIVKDIPDDTTFYEWYYTTIRNKLYLFRTNDTNFYEVETDISDPLGVAVNSLVPTFITISAQLGMFRLGSRLGFWDGTNAIATSSADDLTDFKPDILTGANVTTFNSVVGKISAVRPHGKHAIVYASKSVIFLALQPGDTFLVKASPILQDTGVPYSKQSVISVPDSTHFVYTSTGIYKIEESKPELIVPEVFDYFKRYTSTPVYLRILQGRYLCFECMDPRMIDGDAEFSLDQIPEQTLVFPGVPDNLTDTQASDPALVDECGVMTKLSAGGMDDQQALAIADIPEGWKGGTTPTPIWTCYLAREGASSDDITFKSNPCGSTNISGSIVWPMTPDKGPKTLDQLTTDSTHKTAIRGDEAYQSGGWTMQRFIQAQTAIWEIQEKAIEGLINKIKGQAFFDNLSTPNVSNCIPSPSANTYCDLGTYVTKFSDPKFGYNACSFWLTRYALETQKLRSRFTAQSACDSGSSTDIVVAPVGYAREFSGSSSGNVYADPSQALLDGAPSTTNTIAAPTTSRGAGGDGSTYTMLINGLLGKPAVTYAYIKDANGSFTGANIVAVYPPIPAEDEGVRTFVPSTLVPAGTIGVPSMVRRYTAGYATRIDTKSAVNEVEATNTGILGVESAYCEITGWNYIDKNGVAQTATAKSCTDTQDKYPQSVAGGRAVPADDDRPSLINPNTGEICGLPYEIPAILDDTLGWPDQTVDFPAVTTLLQVGSIAPHYPTLVGSFIYDLHLKKWGKLKLDYKLLMEMVPINSESVNPIQVDNFGIIAGCFKEDGYIYLFDEKPVDSKLTWGKIGYYRLGMTDIQEILVNFARAQNGYLEVECSLDGINTITNLKEQAAYSGLQGVIHPRYSAKWFNISLLGNYDVVGFSIDMARKGRR